MSSPGKQPYVVDIEDIERREQEVAASREGRPEIQYEQSTPSDRLGRVSQEAIKQKYQEYM